MPTPDPTIKFHEKDHLERVLDQVIQETQKSGKVSQSTLNRVAVAAQIQEGIDKYRAAAARMTLADIQDEAHDSARLARHLEEAGYRRPPRCHAHALVAGKHPYAGILRVLMAHLQIRIDDTDNGCWLPENTAATPHPAFPKAPPHSRIHRYNYFFWISSRLRGIDNPGRFRKMLQVTGQMLQQGRAPDYVMLPKGQGLPNGGKL